MSSHLRTSRRGTGHAYPAIVKQGNDDLRGAKRLTTRPAAHLQDDTSFTEPACRVERFV
jgi:hypothetical protein